MWRRHGPWWERKVITRVDARGSTLWRSGSVGCAPVPRSRPLPDDNIACLCLSESHSPSGGRDPSRQRLLRIDPDPLGTGFVRLPFGDFCETNVPTQQPATCPQARLPTSHVDQGGTRHREGPAPQGPPAAQRLIDRFRDSADFAAIRRDGRRLSGKVLWMVVALDAHLDAPRVAFAMGRKSGRAVHRNRLRRRIQHVLRNCSWAVPPGRYLIGCRGPARAVTFDEVVVDLDDLLVRLGSDQ